MKLVHVYYYISCTVCTFYLQFYCAKCFIQVHFCFCTGTFQGTELKLYTPGGYATDSEALAMESDALAMETEMPLMDAEDPVIGMPAAVHPAASKPLLHTVSHCQDQLHQFRHP